MTIIDLVKSTQLQLGPYLELKEKFTKETEQFFSALEKNESELAKAESADTVRQMIKKYERACKDIGEEFTKQSAERVKN